MMEACDRAAMLRDASVASLIRYDTLAGPYVEAWRTEGIPDGDMPRIVVTTEEDYDGVETAPPGFDVTLSLIVSAYVEQANRQLVTGMLDTLVAQIREALFADPDWVRLITRVTGVRVRRKYDNRGERLVGEAHTLITATWKERYPPRVPDFLKEIHTTVRVGSATPVVIDTKFPKEGQACPDPS